MGKFYARTTAEITESEQRHMELARSLAGECVVLLENDGVLPVRAGRVALFGNGARETIKGGTGSGDVNSRSVVNVEEGLEKAGFEVTTKEWLTRFSRIKTEDRNKWQKWVQEESNKRGVPPFTLEFSYPLKESVIPEVTEEDIRKSRTDTAVYVVARNSGEGADRRAEKGDYMFYDEELHAIKVLAESYQNFILVLNIGGIMELTPLQGLEGINALVLMGQLGNIGGHVLADVLTGAVTPSGKLVDTFAREYRDYPSSATFSHNNGDVDDEFYYEGIYVGYRYFDSFGVKPLYPFGYGQSYTQFAIQTKRVSQKESCLEVTVTVTNTGSQYSGKEVVQVYGSAPSGDVKKAYQTLVGYAKTSELAPGQSETLTIQFPLDSMASYSEKEAAWVLEAGKYVIRVGNSSASTTPCAQVLLKEKITCLYCKNFFARDVAFDELTKALTEENVDAPELVFDGSCYPAAKVVYQKNVYSTSREAEKEFLTLEDVRSGKCSVEALVSQLTVEEMADLCVGIFRTKDDPVVENNVIGNSSQAVPGAAGETTSRLLASRHIPNLILADGPAGLRLTAEFEEDNTKYYQYCTAIPIAWSLAMSWNEVLVEEIGNMVGEEMEEFHVDLWLAPALNIHRNPLCGRNFEYYSEDPLVSGKMAAAITRGVQRHPGRGTTIKHFAGNNQEDNRFFSNSHISEQAFREIYLKGFEIAVRQSQPKSIMTSYNLVNGTHTPNRKDLLTYVARNEWGFKGFFMTDWMTSVDAPEISMANKPKYPISSSVGCIYAGNDVQMPGCHKNVQDIIDAVKKEQEIDGYSITRDDLEECVKHILGFFF